MVRQVFVLCVIYYIIQGLPSYTDASLRPQKEDVKMQCDAQYPGVTVELSNIKEEFFDKLFKAAELNATNAKCYIGCIMKLFEPNAFLENGDVIIDKLSIKYTNSQVLEKMKECATLPGTDDCDQMYQRISCIRKAEYEYRHQLGK